MAANRSDPSLPKAPHGGFGMMEGNGVLVFFSGTIVVGHYGIKKKKSKTGVPLCWVEAYTRLWLL